MDSGGMGVSYGMQSQQVRDGEQQLTSHGSQIGSAGGDLHIEAGNRLAVTGSDLIAGKNMSLSGDSVTIRASENQSNQQHSTLQKQTGLTLGLGGSAGSLINNSVDQARNARQESNDRLAALSATQSALSGYQAEQLAQTQNPAQGGLDSVGLNLSLGTQTSRSESHSTRHEAQGSSLNAGSNMSITARGGSQDTHSGDIVVSGSRATAGGSMALQASRDIALNSAENSASSRSSNQSQGGSIGVGLSTQGLNASASGNQSRGHENSDSLSHTNSSLSAGQQLTLESGRDTSLTGATASGH